MPQTEQSPNTPTCLTKRLSLEDAAQDKDFTGVACQVAGCALRYRMADAERLPYVETTYNEQGNVWRMSLSEPYTGVLKDGNCKEVSDFWLSSPLPTET